MYAVGAIEEIGSRNDWAIHTARTVFFCPRDCPPAGASP